VYTPTRLVSLRNFEPTVIAEDDEFELLSVLESVPVDVVELPVELPLFDEVELVSDEPLDEVPVDVVSVSPLEVLLVVTVELEEWFISEPLRRITEAAATTRITTTMTAL
jgi:hypothetical protein